MYKGHFWPIHVHLWRWGVQNMAIWGVKTGLLWQACYGVRTQPGNLFMCHITSHYMGKHVFGPFFTYPCTFMALGGPKYGHCGGQNRVIEAGLSHDQDSVLCAISLNTKHFPDETPYSVTSMPQQPGFYPPNSHILDPPSAIKVPVEVKNDPYTC